MQETIYFFSAAGLFYSYWASKVTETLTIILQCLKKSEWTAKQGQEQYFFQAHLLKIHYLDERVSSVQSKCRISLHSKSC